MLRPGRALACLLAEHAPAAVGQARGGAWGLPAAAERGAHRGARGADDEAARLADKRERRRQRREANRQLKERVCSSEWQWGPQQARKPRRAAQQEAVGPAQPRSDFEMLQAVLGKPRSPAEHRRFSRLWQHWQAAAERAERAERSASASASSGSGSSNTRSGSAGASAGPRWGQASYTWEDLRQEASSGGGGPRSSAGFEFSFSWGDEEAWYEPRRSGRHGGSRSGRHGGASGAWGWRSTWQQQHPGSGGWQHGGGSTSTAGSLQLLGLGTGWLSSCCGRLLRRAYLAQAKALHPDVHAGSGQSAAAAAEARFKEVQAAYEALQALVPPAGAPAGPPR